MPKKKKNIASDDKALSRGSVSFINRIAEVIHKSNSETEVISILHDSLIDEYSLLESNIYFFDEDKRLVEFCEVAFSGNLKSALEKIEEEGIIDWAVSQNDVKIIPNLEFDTDTSPVFFIIVPVSMRGKPYGIWLAKSYKNESEFSKEELDNLKIITEYTAVAINNIAVAREIELINLKLKKFNTQLFQSSRSATIGELTLSVFREMQDPLNIIDANLSLMDTGVDLERRIEIIKDKFNQLKHLNQKLLEFSDINESISENTNLKSLIDEIIELSNLQLRSKDIEIENDIDDNSIFITCNKNQIEQAFLNIIHFSKDLLPDGGSINCSIFINNQKKVTISLSDNGIGLSEEQLEEIFEPTDLNSQLLKKSNILLAKTIIESHNGKLSIFSEQGKGTIYKVTLPIGVAE